MLKFACASAGARMRICISRLRQNARKTQCTTCHNMGSNPAFAGCQAGALSTGPCCYKKVHAAWWIRTDDLLLVRTAPLPTRPQRNWWACIVSDTYDKHTYKKNRAACPVGKVGGQTDGRTDRRTDTTKLYSPHILQMSATKKSIKDFVICYAPIPY